VISYTGRHAALYDLFYANKPYAAEAEFVKSRFEKFGVRRGAEVLDVACGTGRHALELAARGYRVTGVDNSDDMLARARDSAASASASIEYHVRDMRNIDLGGHRFDAATCLFDSIGYVATTAGVIETLGSIYEHLRPDAVVVIEYWHAAAMLRLYDPVRVRRWETADSDIERISETVLRASEQLADVHYTIREFRRDGTVVSLSETHTNRYFLCEEMDQLLRTAGFVPLARYSGYDEVAPITEDTWHVVAAARRPADSR
jgi:SAM-dependent methyltransferase